MIVNNVDWGFGGDDWSVPPTGPDFPIPDIVIDPRVTTPAPVTLPAVTTTPTPVMDRSATLGDLATLGGVLSMAFLIFGKGR